MLLVVYEDQRMISWSLSTFVDSRNGTQITGLAWQTSFLVEPSNLKTGPK